MYPNDIIPGFGFYELFYALALMTALLMYRILADRTKLDARVYNLALGAGIACIIGGYVSSVLFQSLYDYIETGTFRLGTGMTFYGGLLGGIAVFLLVYFIVGHYRMKDKAHIRNALLLEDIAACCVVSAHGIGRFGCLFAGCCHGAGTDAWYGIYHVNLGYKAVPTQLFEALFLLVLAGYCVYRTWHGKSAVSQYLIVYGVWRFFIEYLRTDDRGATIIAALTPSQLTAVLFVLGGVVLAAANLRVRARVTAES